MTLIELNAIDRCAFTTALGGIFEDSPWVAERAWEMRPFSTLDGLHEAMTSVVLSAPAQEQLALLRAHPDLGAVRPKPDTTDGSASAISEASIREQGGAGLDRLTSDEFGRLGALNAAYRDKFGFPFLYAVKGSTKHDVLNALERRLLATRDGEHNEALRQVFRIARFRLEELIS